MTRPSYEMPSLPVAAGIMLVGPLFIWRFGVPLYRRSMDKTSSDVI